MKERRAWVKIICTCGGITCGKLSKLPEVRGTINSNLTFVSDEGDCYFEKIDYKIIRLTYCI